MPTISGPYHINTRELETDELPVCVRCEGDLCLDQPCVSRADRLTGYCPECDVFAVVLGGIVVDLDLEPIARDAQRRFLAPRRGRITPAPHLRLSGAPADPQ